MYDQSDVAGRRNFLLVTGAAALAAATTTSAATDDHQHSAMQYGDLAHESQHCVMKGNACLAHCITDLRSGSTDLVECLASVEELVAICTAMAKVASLGTDRVLAMAAVTKAVCDACEAECRKFADRHKECLECADACVACAKECDAILG